MAFPYLLVGAFPRLVSFLPKPGDWMETFKHLMAFVLLGTVVFILTFIRLPLVVPTIAMMIGLWMALWWVGRVPVWEDLNKRLRAWTAGAAIAALIGMLSFMWLDDVMESRFQQYIDDAVAKYMSQANVLVAQPGARHVSPNELPWQPYSHELLSQMASKKRTVFIDFTAHW
jgi:thiol:disulfide interchange protein